MENLQTKTSSHIHKIYGLCHWQARVAAEIEGLLCLSPVKRNTNEEIIQ
jgi:hypothetical protein